MLLFPASVIGGGDAVLEHDAWWYEFIFHGFHFLEAFVDGDFADAADGFELFLGDVELAVLGNEVDDSCGDGMRGVVEDDIVFFDFAGDEEGEFGQFLVDIEPAAVSFDERACADGHEICFCIGVHVSFDIVQDGHGHGASVGGAGSVKMEDFCYFVRGAGTPVESTGHVDGRGLHSVAVESAEHFLFGDVFVDAHGGIDENFGYTCVLRHDGDELELFVEGFFSMRDGLPFGPSAYFFHFVGGVRVAEDFAPDGRFCE